MSDNSDELDKTEASLQIFDSKSQKRLDNKIGKNEKNLIPVLKVIKGDLVGEHFILNEEKQLTMGRDQDCDLSIKDPKLSRHHCHFIVDEPTDERATYRVKVIDNDSRNGIRLNGKKIKKIGWLTSGDKVKVGSNIFGFYLKYPEEVELENYLYKLASRDATTGLLSKSFFDSTLEFEFKRSRRYGRPLTFVLMDLDFFKKVNDNYGHQKGDEVLARTGEILLKELRFEDTAIRYGGEEFALLLPETTVEAALVVLERIRKCIMNESFLSDDGESFQVTASFGAAEAKDTLTKDELVKQGDGVLYQAKDDGRNRICLYNPEASKPKVA